MPVKQPKTSYEQALAESRAKRGFVAPSPPTIETPEPAPTAGPAALRKPRRGAAPRQAAATAPVEMGQGRAAQAEAASMAAPDAAPQTAEPPRRVMLSVAVNHPAPGHCRVFDEIAARHGANTAMKTVLKRAFDAYEPHLAAGDPGDPDARYPEATATVNTTRMMDAPLVERARAHFDPLGVASLRALSRSIATAALVRFFETTR